MDAPTNSLATIAPAVQLDSTTRRELAIASWLAEKSELSQSAETRRAYDAMLVRFRRSLALAGLDLDAEHRQVALVA